MTEPSTLTPTEPTGEAFDDARFAADAGAANLLTTVIDQIGGKAGANAVFGEPIERGNLTVVPVAQMIIGAGAGNGIHDEAGSGAGAGSGALTRPIGHIEISEAGAQFVPLRRPWFDGGLMVALAFSGLLAAKAISKLLRG
jgi:uncharacterized spore protein YtfJ